MIKEVLAALFSGLSRADEVAALAWKGLGAVYPRGYGMGYSHLGGVLVGLRRCGRRRTWFCFREVFLSESLGGRDVPWSFSTGHLVTQYVETPSVGDGRGRGPVRPDLLARQATSASWRRCCFVVVLTLETSNNYCLGCARAEKW